jgi:predicted nucleotidyltransferase component of viral defense system
MDKSENIVIRVHEDPDLFREAVNFTAAEIMFIPRLIEKDYFCTLLLHYLAPPDGTLVFKGGTCLAKVHASFYRLSEDLDFVIPMSVDASRSARSASVARIKESLANLPENLHAFRVVEPLTGANNSTQYIATISYNSLLGEQEETIKIEVGLREPLLTAVHKGSAQTILLNPVTGKSMVPALPVPCISLKEAMAEKLRAALSRREVAIRDFYDIDFAVRRLDLQIRDAALVGLVRQKLDVPGNESVDVSGFRLDALRQQLHARLKPVLRRKDFAEFDLKRAFKIAVDVAAMIGEEDGDVSL